MRSLKALLKKLLPRAFYRAALAPYHAGWSLYGAVRYGFPAKKLVVIGVTGTKGKSSVSEMITAILEEAGHKVAVSSTIHFKIGDEVRPNLFKMTLPGRGFIQKFLRDAVNANCTHAVIEVTSEGAVQYRHLFLSLDALVFTNLEKEHLESHGSMENYFRAKFRIAEALAASSKRPRAIIANTDNEYGKRFINVDVEQRVPFGLHDAENIERSVLGVSFMYRDTPVSLSHPGDFSVLNALAALKVGEFLGIPLSVAASGLQKLVRIAGRAEHIEEGQNFLAVVDYAHTPDSLAALYSAYEGKRKICVLGNTGGGRDTWKRPEMGRIAEIFCDEVILTNEDPYDEDPKKILEEMATSMTKKPKIIMDRREAIHTALSLATPDDAVLITGKGTDPYIMGARGSKIPWSDAQVVREELQKLL